MGSNASNQPEGSIGWRRNEPLKLGTEVGEAPRNFKVAGEGSGF